MSAMSAPKPRTVSASDLCVGQEQLCQLIVGYLRRRCDIRGEALVIEDQRLLQWHDIVPPSRDGD
jgi:hypothetical protein